MSISKLVDDLSVRLGKNKTDTRAILDTLGETVAKNLGSGEEVTLPGVGKLKTKAKPAREGRNPKTGEPVQIAAKTVIKFTPASALNTAVN